MDKNEVYGVDLFFKCKHSNKTALKLKELYDIMLDGLCTHKVNKTNEGYVVIAMWNKPEYWNMEGIVAGLLRNRKTQTRLATYYLQPEFNKVGLGVISYTGSEFYIRANAKEFVNEMDNYMEKQL